LRYRFGEFELDGDAYTLTRRGEDLALQRKAFDLVRYLLERSGQLVTKTELLDALWAGEHVNEGAVPWTVHQARRALGQDRSDRGPIETVQGRGYRFVASVERLEAPAHTHRQVAATPLPFVGRADAMRQLEARLSRALAGEGGLCVLVGEAGIGKSRCAEELRSRAASQGVLTWTGRSVEGLGAPVFWPWIQVLREAVRERTDLRDAGESLLARMAALDEDTGSGGEQPPNGRGKRFWVLDELSRFLLDAAARVTVTLLLEDLHWADSATLEALTYLTRELARSRLLIVGTMRNETVELNRGRIERLLRGAERVDLAHLTPEDVGVYIGQVTRRTPSPSLCGAVYRASAGNPLFLQETIRTLQAEHGDRLASLEPAAVAPSSLARDVLRSRLSALDAAALSVLTSASVLGESFEVAILQRLRDQPLDFILEALERAAGGLLISGDGPHRWRFAHALLRSILYEDMPGSERVATHRRAAELLSELALRSRRYSEIAHHFYRSLPAGDYGRVTAAARRAAEAAGQVHAFEDAATYYEWALEAQALDPKTKARDRADLLFAYGSVERLSGRYEKSRRTLATVIELARQHGYSDLLLRAARVMRTTHAVGAVPDRLVRSALEDVLRISGERTDPERISALSLLACVPPYANDMARSLELSGEAVDLARKLGDPGPLREALCARLYSLSGPDHIDARLAAADELLAQHGQGEWTRFEAYVARIGATLYRGDVGSADAALREVDLLVREARLPEGIWFHDRIRNQRRILEGDFAVAKAGYKELIARGKRMGLSYEALFTTAQRNAIASFENGLEEARDWNLGLLFALGPDGVTSEFRAGLVALAAELGREREARSMLDAMAARDFENLPKDLGYLCALTHLARAAALLDDRARCERLYGLLAPYAELNTPNTMLFYEGSASHPLALCAATVGWQDRVRPHFEAAVAMNEQMGALPLLARTKFDFAGWLATTGDRAFREVAHDAESLAASLHMGWLAERARELAR